MDAFLYKLQVGEENHSLFEVPHECENISTSSFFNLVMMDVSGSMNTAWKHIEKHWNCLLGPILKGSTKIYTFGSEIKFRRHGVLLKSSDLDNSATDLTGAIKKIGAEVINSKEELIRVFLVTDGEHNHTPESPDTAIKKLRIPRGTTVEVYLLGVRNSFPVEYSISLRSCLHNGNSNVPSLFWAEDDEDIENEIKNIAEIIRRGYMEFEISLAGCLCPGMPAKDKVHLGEFVYYPYSTENLEKNLKLTSEKDGANIEVKINMIEKDMTLQFLLDNVFRQWNSILLQIHRNKEEVPMNVFTFMDKIYKTSMEKLVSSLELLEDSKSIKSRLAKKHIKRLETEYAALMNQSKAVIELEGNFASEIELARQILRTTVKSKYDSKNLKMRGHSFEDYQKDMSVFKEIYYKNRDAFMALPEPLPEECCHVTFGSTVADLQDPTFPELMAEDKFVFLRTFCVTGLPIFAPVKDASQINAWTLKISKILVSPFNLLSQCTLEFSAELTDGLSEDSAIFLREGDNDTKVNAIIPIFPCHVADILKPLVRSNIFAMLATFCILKNPHVIDMNVHMAALGCAYIKSISEYPKVDRPQFIMERLKMIEATAQLYLDRKGYATYIDALLNNTCEALMTESREMFGDLTIKCESLIKPAFFLCLLKDSVGDKEKLKNVLRLICAEFIGRCFTKYEECTPYSNQFVYEFRTEERKNIWLDQQLKDTVKVLDIFIGSHGPLLATFFKPEDLKKSIKLFCYKHFAVMSDSIYSIKLDMEKVKSLHNEASAGHLNWQKLKSVAEELDILTEDFEFIFSEESAFVYVSHALQYRNSINRMSSDISSYEEAFIHTRRRVDAENAKTVRKRLLQKVMEVADQKWHEEYMEAHKSVIKPMSAEEMVKEAIGKGVDVNDGTFNAIYRYNKNSGLVRNACMDEACPHYMKPNRTFNQHISVERKHGFLHNLHRVSLEVASKGGKADDVFEALLTQKKWETENVKKKRKTTTIPTKGNLESHRLEIQNLIQLYQNLILG